MGALTESKAKATRDELPVHDPARVWPSRRKSKKELLAWYADWRQATLAKIPGCLGMRKLVGAVDWNNHGVMYEFLSLDARNKGMADVVRHCLAEAAWTEACVPKLIHAPGSPHIAQRIAALEK